MPRDLTVLLVKANTGAYATDAAPTAGANAFLAFNYNPLPYEADEVRRDVDRGFPGATDLAYVAERQMQPFSVELTGGGAVLTAAKWGELLRGSMFGAATVEADHCAYPLISAGDGADLTIYGWKDNMRTRTVGARGNAKFVFELNRNPRIEFDPMGLMLGNVPIAADAAPAPTLPTTQPVHCNKFNTSISLGGYQLGLDSFEIDLGMKPVFYETMSEQSVIFDKDQSGDRRAIGFRYSCELPDPALKNYYADIRAQTALALALTHGTVAGSIIEIASTVAKMGKPTFTVRNNRLFMSGDGRFVPTAANNELTLKTR